MHRFHLLLLALTIAFAALGGEILWGDVVVWGTLDGDSIVWGTLGDGDTVVWGN